MEELIKADIRSKEQQMQWINGRISTCIQKEASIHRELSQLRQSLSRKNSFEKPEQLQRKISEQERKLSELLRERERYERDRESLFRELNRLQRNLEQEQSAKERAAKKEQEERNRKAKREQEEKERQARRTQNNIAASVTSQVSATKKPRKKIGMWKILLFFLVAGAIANIEFPDNSAPPQKADDTIPSMTTEYSSSGLVRWIGLKADDIFAQYGKDFQLGYIAGGNYFYYEDTENCPYSFFYYEESLEPEADDIIWGAATGVGETFVTEDIQIGDPLQAVEAALGYPLDPQSEDGSDFYPFLEATANIEGVKYLFLFDPESKDLVYAMSGQY